MKDKQNISALSCQLGQKYLTNKSSSHDSNIRRRLILKRKTIKKLIHNFCVCY